MAIAFYKSPLGYCKIEGDEMGISAITLLDTPDQEEINTIPDSLTACVTQLEGYFNGTLKQFDLKLNPSGTAFQKKVWLKLLDIPFGTTVSYMDQTKKIGDVKAIRAVASANGKNPIAIIIPCHRVIGSDGSLTGYAGGIWRKKWLLEHESPVIQQKLF